MMVATTMLLSDLCDFVGMQVDPSSLTDQVYYGLEHVTPGRFVANGEGKASDVQSSKYVFQRGDVLYGKLRPYLDKAILAAEDGICTTELLVLRPKAGVDPRFLVGVVHAPSFIAHSVAGTTGVQHPRTSWNHVSGFQLPAFESEEQTKIAALLWRVHDNLTANEATIEAGSGLKRAAMATLFARGLKGEAQKETDIGLMPESWSAEPIATLTSTVYRYPTYYNISYRSDGVPEIRGELLKDGGEIENDLSQFRFIDEETAARFPKVRLKAGDIVMSVRGTMGKIGIVRDIHVGAVITANLIRLAPNSEKIVPEFFKYALTSERFLEALNRASPQTTIKTITAPDLKSLRIPTPPTLNEQQEVVAILDAIDRKIDLHKQKRAVLDELFKSLLHKLMTGEIRVADLDLSALEKKAVAA
jgi:type I restriction enzyme, S subunit